MIAAFRCRAFTCYVRLVRSFSRTTIVPCACAPETIAQAYQTNGTDGILQLPCSDDETGSVLWENTWQAAQHTPGRAASMLNAWLGNCYQHNRSDLARNLVECAFPKEEQDSGGSSARNTIRPDVVTHSLLYCLFSNENHLQQAVKGSDYSGARKKRAAARRRNRAGSFTEAQPELQTYLGTDFAVLYETNDYAVVNKPSGVACFHQRTTRSGKASKKNNQKADVSLEDAVLNAVSCTSHIDRGLVHRLDRGTSGCLILPKSEASHARLVTDFFLRRIHKTYQCLVWNTPKQDAGIMDGVVDNRPASSSYKVLERFGDSASLLLVETLTGRKHQVRVHCAQDLGCPIVGDNLYGQVSSDKESLFLHAASLVVDGRTISAPLPSFWQERLKQFS